MRNYTRKTNRGCVSLELMQAAASEVLEKGVSVKRTAREMNICHTTLFRFIQKIKSGEEPTIGHKPKLLFNRQQEQDIVKNLAEFAKVFCGLTVVDVRKFACQCAITLKFANIPESWHKNGRASKEWADKFITRHQLPIQPFPMETKDINKCYGILHKLMEEYKFLPSRMYHLVDIVISKVVKYKKKADGTVSMSLNQWKPVNMQFAANATGETVPPMFVTDEYNTRNVIKNSTGRMTEKDFLVYLDHFIKHTKPKQSGPVLLLIDNHEYIDVNVLERARANSVVLLSFPKEHSIQPLKNIVKNVLESCNAAQVDWLSSKPDTACDILEIASKVISEVTEKDIVKCFRKTGVWPFNPTVVTGEEFVPTAAEEYDFKVSQQEAQPGPSKAQGTRTSLDSNASTIPKQDPLSRVVIEQCRFCGEFSKDCISVSSNMPYLAHNKTALVLNDTSVQLDFNDGSLPNTVCRDCDAKLQEIADFVKVVKAAQDTLINVAEERAQFSETRVEFEVPRAGETVDTETETIVIKTEYDSQHEESDDDKEDKEGIVDSLTVGETVFIKKSVTHKRKSDTVTAKPKKLKTKKDDDELIINIKEEVIEEEGQEQSEVSDYVKPSELELATSGLVFEMAGEGTSEYEGNRSDR